MAITLGRLIVGPKHAEIIRDRGSGIRVLTGGYGSAKTTTGAACVLDIGLRFGHHGPILATEPTYSMVTDTMVPVIDKVCSMIGIPCRYKIAKHIFIIGKHKKFEIWCRGLDKPRSCEGINAIAYWGDEWELCKPESFLPAMARVRVGPQQEIILTGTPEGFNANYKMILDPIKRKSSTREYILSTKDNPFLPPDYYENTKALLPSTEAIMEKLEGLRTAKGGRVYSRFSRENNQNALRSMSRFQRTRYAIACDFNVAYMHFLIAEIDDNMKCAKIIGEVVHEGGTTTDDHCERTWEKLSKLSGQPIYQLRKQKIKAYCDSYGSARSSVSYKSNFALMEQAGFQVVAPSKNPPTEERVNTLQCLFRDNRIYVDPYNCPILISNLETQAYDKVSGEPDKKNNIDHSNDSLGYMTHYLWPVHAPRPNEYKPDRYEADEWGFR